MKKMNVLLALVGFGLLVLFQNCSDAKFSNSLESSEGANNVLSQTQATVEVTSSCLKTDCGITPLVDKPGVVTILLALGDEVNNQVIVNGGSAKFLAETSVRYATQIKAPKILLVLDRDSHGESAYDPKYIAEVLLARYQVQYILEPSGGLRSSDLQGYDVIWFNNPGYGMSSSQTRDSLKAFAGGVILSGDDMSQGVGFDNSSLTGLKYIDNGTAVSCGGQNFPHDNNGGRQFTVNIDSDKIPGAQGIDLLFKYGNDIDNTVLVDPSVEVIATAVGGDASCTQSRPVIVRYPKK